MPSPTPERCRRALLAPSLLPGDSGRALSATSLSPARCLVPPCRRALAFLPPHHPRRRITFRHSLRSFSALEFLYAPSDEDSSSTVDDAPLVLMTFPEYQSVLSPPYPTRCPPLLPSHSPLPPPTPFPREPPRFRVVLVAPGDVRGLWVVHAPPCGSAHKGPPPAFMGGRRCGFCTSASTRNPCTGAGRFDSRRVRWTGQALNRLSSACSCNTDQPVDGPVCLTYQ